MITAFQKTFQKHARWVFITLLVIMVIPFVFAYAPGSKASSLLPRDKGRLFLGHDLSDEAHVRELGRAASLEQWLTLGYPPQSSEEFQRLIFDHIILSNLADSLTIPTPSTQQLSEYIATLPPFLDENGRFSQELFTQLQERFTAQEGFAKEYLGARIAQSWRLSQLFKNQAAFYLPTSLQREYGLWAAKYTTAVAMLEPHIEEPTLSQEELTEYFEKHQANYRTPELRSGIAYAIPAGKFLSQISEPSEEQLQRFFDSISFRFIEWQMQQDGKPSAEPKAPALADHRKETLELYKTQRAARTAAEAVDVIVQKIFKEKIVPGSKAWEELLEASGAQLIALDALARDNPDCDENTLNALFEAQLNVQPYSGAFATETDGRFVLLKSVELSKDQPLEAVEETVQADALAEKKQRVALEAMGKKVEDLKSTFLAQEMSPDVEGPSFEALAREMGFVVTTPEPFTLSRPALELQRNSQKILRGLLATSEGGFVSDITPKQAVVVWVRAKDIPVFEGGNPEAFLLRGRLESIYKNLQKLSCLGEWAALNGNKK